MNQIVFDIETDGLLLDCTTVWCIAIKVNDNPTEVYTLNPIKGSAGGIEDALRLLKTADVLIGHNIINFDLPALFKLYEVSYDCKLFDTIIASKLVYPNMLMIDSNNSKLGKLMGSHSLKAWGIRLGNYKDQHEDWTKLTEDMVEYCRQDVEVNYTLYNKLLTKNIPDEAMRLEQEFAKIIQRQEAKGWLFDVEKAKELHVELLKEKEKALEELLKVFKPIKTWFPLNEINKYKKDGSLTVNYQKQLDKGACYNDALEWGYYQEVGFNPGSGAQIYRWVTHYFGKQDWEFTEKGSPKTGEKDILKLFSDKDWAKPLVHYFNVKKLLGQLAEGSNAWLKLVRDDNRIHGSVDTLGAVSRRCTHRYPNVAQVPSNKAYKGHECRSLFICPEGYKIVGCDADGLELRTLSHYMAKYDGGKYAEAVDKGDKDQGTDIHTMNQKSAGLPTKEDAKTFIYAFLYGAGDEKIGSIVGGSSKEGKKLKNKFFKQIPAIKQLVEAVKTKVDQQGYLKALDGNKYFIRSSHIALNTLLQGAGALVMKYYCVLLDKELQLLFKEGVDYEFIGNIHDEVQIECMEDIADLVAKICERTFDLVTEELNFRIPLRGSADIGDNWSETH